MDTVEWGTVEPARRRLPNLRYSIPRAGALTLTAGGFLALAGAELMPWGIVHMPRNAPVTNRPSGSPVTEGAGLHIDTVRTFDSMAYHIAVVVLLASIGFGLAGSALRRRAAMGAALGTAAGLGLIVISLNHAVRHFFDNYAGYFGYGPNGEPVEIPTVSAGSGGYLAYLGVVLLAGAAVIAGIWQRGWWERRAASPGAAAGAAPAGRFSPVGPDGERELTVSALEPLDESYFARPDPH